ncbi:hypothetical protein [Streptomyces olivaceiscleroticus]|uniref:E9imm peptide n=1 Tax=Streptomyces olivaceiscleroticus TaxID=68245 RepID=A0ABN1BHM9_9ACTN
MESDHSGSGDDDCSTATDEAVRQRAVALVQRILDRAYEDETELYAHLDWLEQALRCRYVSDLIFWPDVPPSAEDVVRQALSFGPAIPRPRSCPTDHTNTRR